ncbi:DUF6286 domain-containing protein [uncultured Serinicoccus sp.]|uniref:DUF6286 domain-containing protein n=1 Tax=uncultured Serinicoccus sp. TaxID=735514 RepID=UPI00262EDE7A|nr:DUF6286 domain-containing protein [uncultured Serinicoccus sp.]
MRTPRRRPVAIWPALLLAAGLVTLGVLSVRELLVMQGWLEGSPWLTPVLTGSLTLAPDTRTLALGVAAVLLGLVLLVIGLRPGARTHRRAPGEVDVWASQDALTHLAREAAERTHGVSAVERAASSRSGVRLTVRTPMEDARDHLTTEVTRSVEQRLEGVAAPRVAVTVKEPAR